VLSKPFLGKEKHISIKQDPSKAKGAEGANQGNAH